MNEKKNLSCPYPPVIRGFLVEEFQLQRRMALHLAHMSSATAVLVVDKQTIIKIRTAFLNFIFPIIVRPPACLTCWYAFPLPLVCRIGWRFRQPIQC